MLAEDGSIMRAGNAVRQATENKRWLKILTTIFIYLRGAFFVIALFA